MKTTVENLDDVKVKLSVEVEPKRVKQAMDAAARELAKQVNLPGFRPGKAPRKLLEQRLGPGVIAQQALEDSLSDFYTEAIQSEELEPVAQPEVAVEVFDEKEGCKFTAELEVRPDIDLPDHTGIGVTFPEWDVSDEDVEEQLFQLRDRFAEVEEVDRAAKRGDYVTLDLEVFVDGEELEDAHVEDALYEVGSAGVTPKLDDELQGAVAGAEVSYTDKLPDEYPEHGGEEAEFKVTVKDVREKTLPDLDDDFAMTASEFDTLEELKKDIRDNLLRQRITAARQDLRNRIIEAYLALVDFPLPPSMVQNETQARVGRVEQQAEQMGVEVEDLLEDTTRDQFEANAAKAAENAVKAQLVLDELAQELDLEIHADDLDREVLYLAQRYGAQPQEIANQIVEQGNLPALVADVMRRKAIDALVDEANIDGAPSEMVMVELGLQPDPNAEEAAQAEDGDAEDDQPEGLVVPGQGDAGDASELIVPGRDG